MFTKFSQLPKNYYYLLMIHHYYYIIHFWFFLSLYTLTTKKKNIFQFVFVGLFKYLLTHTHTLKYIDIL